MHAPWINDFEEFLAYTMRHLGPRPSEKHSIDRIENDGHYEPGNIRWATTFQQAQNRSTSKLDDWDVRFIRHWREIGFKPKAIATVFGVRPAYVSQVAHGHKRATA